MAPSRRAALGAADAVVFVPADEEALTTMMERAEREAHETAIVVDTHRWDEEAMARVESQPGNHVFRANRQTGEASWRPTSSSCSRHSRAFGDGGKAEGGPAPADAVPSPRMLRRLNLVLLCACATASCKSHGDSRPSLADVYRACESNDGSACSKYREEAVGPCSAGDGEACFKLGLLWFDGMGGEVDREKALAFHAQGCEAGSMPSCFNLGSAAEQGLSTEPNPHRARHYYSIACAGGLAEACNNLAGLWHEGLGGEQDPVQARSFYRQGCQAGGANACYGLAVALEAGTGGDVDLDGATAAYEKACDLGALAACNNLGQLLGQGVGGDPSRPPRLFSKGCEGGHALACVNLGISLASGRGVEKDYRQASVAFDRACSAGEQQGCIQLADLLLRGLGVPKDASRGRSLLRVACESNDGEGCLRLAMDLQLAGEVEAAKTALVDACDLGVTSACLQLDDAVPRGGERCEEVMKHTFTIMQKEFPGDGLRDFDMEDAVARCRARGLAESDVSCALSAKTYADLVACQ